MPGVGGSFSQPIQFRMTELIEGIGIRSELGIKLFGDDLEILADKAGEISQVMRSVPGAADVSFEATEGLPVLNVTLNRAAIARYGINVSDVQDVLESAIGGKQVGQVIQGNRRFDLTVRLGRQYRDDPEAIERVTVESPDGANIPLAQLANIQSTEGPVQISRENGERRVVIQSNVRGRDLGSFVEEVKRAIDAKVKLPTGYHVEYGGTYEHLQSGRARLMIVVPLTFGLIFLLLFTTFGSVKQAAPGVHRHPLRHHRRHAGAVRAGHAVFDVGRRGIHRAVWRGGAQRRGAGDVHQRTAREADATPRSGDARLRTATAAGSDDGGGRQHRLPADGLRPRRGRRGAEPSRDGGYRWAAYQHVAHAIRAADALSLA